MSASPELGPVGPSTGIMREKILSENELQCGKSLRVHAITLGGLMTVLGQMEKEQISLPKSVDWRMDDFREFLLTNVEDPEQRIKHLEQAVAERAEKVARWLFKLPTLLPVVMSAVSDDIDVATFNRLSLTDVVKVWRAALQVTNIAEAIQLVTDFFTEVGGHLESFSRAKAGVPTA